MDLVVEIIGLDVVFVKQIMLKRCPTCFGNMYKDKFRTLDKHSY